MEVRQRNSKLMRLIKTKNTLLNVKADIIDFKTRVDNQIKASCLETGQKSNSTADLVAVPVERKQSQMSKDLTDVQ